MMVRATCLAALAAGVTLTCVPSAGAAVNLCVPPTAGAAVTSGGSTGTCPAGNSAVALAVEQRRAAGADLDRAIPQVQQPPV